MKLFKKFEKAETGNQTGNRKLGFGFIQIEFESVSNQTSSTLVYEQQCYACEINESSKGKWKGVIEQ